MRTLSLLAALTLTTGCGPQRSSCEGEIEADDAIMFCIENTTSPEEWIDVVSLSDHPATYGEGMEHRFHPISANGYYLVYDRDEYTPWACIETSLYEYGNVSIVRGNSVGDVLTIQESLPFGINDAVTDMFCLGPTPESEGIYTF